MKSPDPTKRFHEYICSLKWKQCINQISYSYGQKRKIIKKYLFRCLDPTIKELFSTLLYISKYLFLLPINYSQQTGSEKYTSASHWIFFYRTCFSPPAHCWVSVGTLESVVVVDPSPRLCQQLLLTVPWDWWNEMCLLLHHAIPTEAELFLLSQVKFSVLKKEGKCVSDTIYGHFLFSIHWTLIRFIQF